MKFWRHLVLVTLILTGLAAESHADELKKELQAVVLLKVLGFDFSLDAAKDKQLRIGVLSDESSAKQASSMVGAFAKGGKKLTVRGRKIQATKVGADGLRSVDVIYIPSSYSGASAMAERSRKAGVPVLSGTKSFLGKGGAIAVVSEGGKPRIYISQSGAKGLMSLDSKLVRLAKVVP